MEIGPWKRIDERWLKAALHDFLRANLARGGDLLDTHGNVSTLLSLGYAGATSGDPCLTAVVGGEPVGFVLWKGVPRTVDSRWKTVFAYGSYTAAGARGRGVARALRDEARSMSKVLGYERIIGPLALTNTRGMHEFIEQFGAWPTHVQWEALL